MCVKCRGTRRAIAFGSSAALPRVWSAPSRVCSAGRLKTDWRARACSSFAARCRTCRRYSDCELPSSWRSTDAELRLISPICSYLHSSTYYYSFVAMIISHMKFYASLFFCSSFYSLSVTLPAYTSCFLYFRYSCNSCRNCRNLPILTYKLLILIIFISC